MKSAQKPGRTGNAIGRRGLLKRAMLKGSALVGALLTGAAARSSPVSAADAAAPAMLKNIGLCVTDLERSRLFYTEVFGFKADSEPQTIGPQLGGLLEVENMNVTIQFLSKQGINLELIDYTSPATLGDGTRRPMNQLGLTHLAFKVTNVAAMSEAVEHMGGTVLEQTRLGSGDKTAAIFVLDPDGTRIELTTL